MMNKQKLEEEKRKIAAVAYILKWEPDAKQEDFIDRPVYYADNLACHLCQMYIKDYLQDEENEDCMFEFSGQNCYDCQGWDGRNRRCKCGNRRVYWEFHGSFEDVNPEKIDVDAWVYVRAEAY